LQVEAPAIHTPIDGVSRFNLPWQLGLQWDGPEEPGEQGPPVWLRLDERLRKEGYWFNAKAADRFEKVCNFVYLTSGNLAGKRIQLPPYQRAFFRRLYGWMRPREKYPTPTRRYNAADLWVPKGNFKTTGGGVAGLYMLTMDGEQRANVELMANTAEQAMRLTFAEMKAMISNSPELSAAISLYGESIYFPQTQSKARVLPTNAKALDGLNPSFIHYDEVHEFTMRAVYEKTRLSLKKRAQPIELITSTAGANTLIFGYELYESAKILWEGRFDDPYRLALVFSSDPEKEDWKDPAIWAKVNPTWGWAGGLNEDMMRAEMNRIATDPLAETNFRVLHVGQWVRGETAAVPVELWNRAGEKARKGEFPTIEELAKNGAVWHFGMDVSLSDDLTAFIAVATMPNGEAYAFEHIYAPKEVLELRGNEHRVDYAGWAKSGKILATAGDVVDTGRVIKDISEFHKRAGRFIAGHADQALARDPIQELNDKAGVLCVPVPQNFNTFTPAARRLHELLSNGMFHHRDNPVLNWMCANLSYIQSGDLVRPRKYGANGSGGAGRKRRYKIDGMVALLLGLHAGIVAKPSNMAKLEDLIAMFSTEDDAGDGG